MPITSLPYWFAKCDNCGERADYDEFTAYEDAGQAADMALGGDWTSKGEVWHCPDCPSLDDEDGDESRRDALDAQTLHDSPGADL